MKITIQLLSVMLAFTITCSAQTAKTAPAKQAKPLSAMSDKDLFKKGEADYAAGRLLDAREAIALGLQKKKKTDPKYTPLLTTINGAIADQEAAKGETACNNGDYSACEKQIAAAKQYATTARVTKLEGTANRAITELRDQFAAASKLADSGGQDKALVQLEALNKYRSYLPNLDAEKARITRSYIQRLLGDGTKLIDQKRWEDSSQLFQRVLELDKENAQAKAGLNLVQRARRGYDFHQQAMANHSTRNYEQALKMIEGAISAYPESREFEPAKGLITRDWINALLKDIPDLVADASDLTKTRDAYLRLDQVRLLDPRNADVAKYMPAASENFGANALEKSADLEAIVDYSRIATAYVMKLIAQQRMPAGTVKPEDLKTLASAFNRKRAAQLLLSIDNLAAAQATFTGTLQVRGRNTLENLGLPDLRVRVMEEYQRSSNEDPQFQDLRPDGKSRTVHLTVGVARYESERRASPQPIQMRSQYVSGTELVLNPEYAAAEAELTRIRAALDRNPKKDKPTPEGWTETIYNQKQLGLARIDRQIQKDKISDYSYSKIEYKQHTSIELTLQLRDYVTREVLVSDRVPFNRDLEGFEITGVKERDVNNLQNQPLLIPPPEQVLREAERSTLEDLDKKLREMLPAYNNRFFNEGEKAMKANRVDDAVEMFICHWAFFRGKLPEAQLERVADVVKRHTGFDLKREGGSFLSLVDTAVTAMQ